MKTKAIAKEMQPVEVATLIRRHAFCDWTGMDPDDIIANKKAIVNDDRILSEYTNSVGKQVFILTDQNRSFTTVMFSNEY